MDETGQNKIKPELSDSWMVIDEPSTDQENNGGPSDGSDGESVEVIDQEEFEEGLVDETDYDTIPPEQEIIGPTIKKYVHHPNNDINTALNKLMILAASIVVGLAVGHYLGYSEEVMELTTSLKKLKAENTILKNHICKLFENYVDYRKENLQSKVNDIGIHSTLYHMILLDINCPEFEGLNPNLKANLYTIKQAHAKNHFTEDELKQIIDSLLQNSPHLNNLLEGKCQNSLQDRYQNDIGINGKLHEVSQSAGEHIHPSKGIWVDTATPAETSNMKNTKETAHSFKSLNKLPAVSSVEKLFVSLLTQTVLPTERTISAKDTDSCLSESELKKYISKVEPSIENILKHIVKDMVYEMTESMLMSHHNNILKDVRDEARLLAQSFPVFKSTLLLNMEVISKLKSHVEYLRNSFKSLPDHSHGSSQQEKVTSVLTDISKYTLSLEKAMNSLKLLETALEQEREFNVRKQQDKVCLVAEFFEKYYINNFFISEDIKKNLNNHQKESSKSENSLSENKVNDVIRMEYIPPKSQTDEYTGKVLQEIGSIKEADKIAVINGYELDHEFPSKATEKIPHGYRVDKGNLITDTHTGDNKRTDSKLKCDENECYDIKYSNKKHDTKYQDSKKMKRIKKEHKKEDRENHNYHDKKIKKDANDFKKKHVNHNNVWVEKENEQKKSNISGEWVINLNKGRAVSREAEHQSDWLFDRASARKIKRSGKWDMSSWYFDRAESRNYYRQKSNTHKSKTYPPPENKGKQFHGKENKKFAKFRKFFKPKYWISKAYTAFSKFKY